MKKLFSFMGCCLFNPVRFPVHYQELEVIPYLFVRLFWIRQTPDVRN